MDKDRDENRQRRHRKLRQHMGHCRTLKADDSLDEVAAEARAVSGRC